jgi:polyphosphate:AMP phosphotransferase
VFEAVELGQTIDKDEFEERLAKLRVDLINAQYDLREADFSMVILLDGDDREGFTACLRDMHDWIDGRYLETHALGPLSDAERERPLVWRYWRRLPRKGTAVVFLHAWAMEGIRRRLFEELDDGEYERWIEHVRRFEEALTADGTLFVKLWFHLPRKELKKKIKKGPGRKQEPRRLVENLDWLYARYEEVMPIAEHMVRETSTGEAPWTLIESLDRRHASLTAAESILSALGPRLAESPAAPRSQAPPMALEEERDSGKTVLDGVDLSGSLERDAYKEKLEDLQADVARLSDKAARNGVASVLAFEGWDAAGKGGVIRRLTVAVDPRLFRVIPIGAPTEEEAAHHYLWRFWNHIPRDGTIAIFDRTWYGRVLVERVEGFATENEWRRAYAEIRDFESQLTEHGTLLQKFFLHIDPDEQMRRFQARELTPYKKHKITDEDYRNREKRAAYEAAIQEMVVRTSIEDAPWHLVPANDKRFARVTVLEHFRDALKRRL